VGGGCSASPRRRFVSAEAAVADHDAATIEVVYEVPINRVHCTEGLFGIVDCEDTGESVTMRIVANINEGRSGIPDGGQKGVVSMYPLAGVVEWSKWKRSGRCVPRG
jgi:hypothetical protein